MKHLSKYYKVATLLLLFATVPQAIQAQTKDTIHTEDVLFKSEGVQLAGTIFIPVQPKAAVVVVHGSGQEARMTQFAQSLAKKDIAVLTYDKRGVAASGGSYAGPEVGTNNIDADNLELLAKDASAAVNTLRQHVQELPIGLVGFSQAGWIIPAAATKNPLVQFMVLFSCPTVTTLEQLRFQFYTNENTNFWVDHTEAEVREHIRTAPDRYQFEATDPKLALAELSIPGLWIFGERDIQIPVKIGIEHLNTLKAEGKPFEYCLFPSLGHSTAFSNSPEPMALAIHWIKRNALILNEK